MAPARWINLELRDSTGAPLSGRSYALTFPDGTQREGRLDADGALHEQVSPDLEKASLDVAQRRFELDLRGMPAVDTVEGAQERLNHLHYFVGDTDGELGPFTKKALARFQRDHDLPITETLDEATVARLREVHGS